MTGQTCNNASNSNLYKNTPQRLCNSEHSSPLVERRKDEVNLDEKGNDKKYSSDCNVSEFAQVSEDMNELVYHLSSIQNDISELAGKPISLCENNT